MLNSFSLMTGIRSFLSLAFAVGILLCSAGQANAQEKFDLKVELPTNKHYRISSVYEHIGRVLVITDSAESKDTKQNVKKLEIKPLKLAVEAKMTYVQRTMSKVQAVRYFENASAKIKLDKGVSNPRLTENNRLVVARSKTKEKGNQEVEMASVKDTLQQTELDLIQNPADPMTLASLLNKEGVKQGDSWKPSKITLAKFLNVNEIIESDVKVLLKKVDDKSARVFVMGDVVADVDDVSTEIQVSGVAVIDRTTNMLSSFKVALSENKKPGQISPGFQGDTKIDLRFSPTDSIKALSNETLAAYVKGGKIRQRLKWVSRLGFCQLIYEPRWRMITEEQEAALLRFIDDKELIAQCNVVLLPRRAANKPLTLDLYKREISKIVDKDKNAKLVTADSTRLPTGETSMRVVVSGIEGGVPVQWFYYNVASPDGRQIAFVFTLESKVSNRAATIAKQLVSEFQFKDPPRRVAAKRNTTAKKTSSTKSRRARSSKSSSQPKR